MVRDAEMHVEKAETNAPEDDADRIFEGFLDIPMGLRVELGRRRYRCGDVVSFRVGTVIALDRSAGENVALLLNGNRIGAGEIVVIEDSMGLRITDIGVRETAKAE
jgi:flagellar motor switch protein FliN/FliY